MRNFDKRLETLFNILNKRYINHVCHSKVQEILIKYIYIYQYFVIFMFHECTMTF